MNKILLMALFVGVIASPTAMAKDVQHTLRIDGISCPFCVLTSERALEKIEGVKQIESSIKEGTITLCADEAVTFTKPQLTQLFEDKGFTYKGKESTDTCNL